MKSLMRNIRIYLKQKGQISLLIILVGVIALSVGLGFVSRSITDSRAAVAQQNSQQALAAAEAGVQLAINKNGSITSPQSIQSGTINNVSQYSVGGSISVTNPEFFINGGNPVPVDDGADIWLIPHTQNVPDFTKTPFSGNITFFWAPQTDLNGNNTNYGCSSGATVPALEVITFIGNAKDAQNKITSASSNRYVFDPCSRISGTLNTFTNASQTGGLAFSDSYITISNYQNVKFNYSATISVGANTYLIKFIPLYNSTIMGIETFASSYLPSQGGLYVSTGSSGDTQRTIIYFRGYPQSPMMYGLYSR